MTLLLGLSLLAVSVEGEVSSESGWRYDRYIASTDCGDRRPLNQKEKTGLTFAADVFRILTIVGKQTDGTEKADWLILAVDGSPMNEAGNFPEGRCASKVVLKSSGGKTYNGIAEYRDPTEGNEEHPGYSMRVLFEETSPITEIRYNSLGFRIDGHINYKDSKAGNKPFAGWSVSVEQWN